jgi:hypothetical protein
MWAINIYRLDFVLVTKCCQKLPQIGVSPPFFFLQWRNPRNNFSYREEMLSMKTFTD